MLSVIIEATNGPQNWGKFMVSQFREEWNHKSAVSGEQCLLRARGWSPQHIMVTDLETGEGAIFLAGGYAKADLDKHKVWVCPLFEPFLEWLYKQDLKYLEKLPRHVDFPEAEYAIFGYRREGK